MKEVKGESKRVIFYYFKALFSNQDRDKLRKPAGSNVTSVQTLAGVDDFCPIFPENLLKTIPCFCLAKLHGLVIIGATKIT